MGVLRSLIAALSLAATMVGPLRAGDDLALTFATCTGRLSATMEHQWLVSDPASERTEAQRAAMIVLMDATTEPGRDRELLSYRIEAKHAQAILLTRATFNDDPVDAAWALTRAERAIASCVGMLLS